MSPELATKKELTHVERFQESVGQFVSAVADYIGPHSRNSMRSSLSLAEEIITTKRGLGENTIQIDSEALSLSGRDHIPYVVEKKSSVAHGKADADLIYVVYPENPEFQPEFFNTKSGKNLIEHYVSSTSRLMRADISSLRQSASPPIDLTSAVLILPKGSAYGPWVSTFGPLTIVGNKAENLTNPETGFGFHPEHELFHRMLQLSNPELYFKIMDRLSLFDEAAAMGYERDQFVSACHRYLDQHSLRLSFADMEPHMGLKAAPLHSPLETNNRNFIQNGNQAVYSRDLAMLFYKSYAGTGWDEAANPLPQLTQHDLTQNFMDDGNTSRRLRELAKGKKELMSFTELMSPKFDSAKYPQIMLFSSFINQLTAAYEQNIITHFKTSPEQVKFNNQRYDFIDKFGDDAYTFEQIDFIKKFDKNKPPYNVIDTIKNNPGIVIDALNIQLENYPFFKNHSYSRRLVKAFQSLEQYLKNTNIDPLQLSLEELTESAFKAILVEVSLSTGVYRSEHLWENEKESKPRDFDEMFNALSSFQIRPAIEKIWQDQTLDWYKQTLAETQIVRFPDRE